MTIEDRKETIISKLELIKSKENELLREGQKILHCEPAKINSFIFNELISKYRDLQVQKEFCNYCLMFDYVSYDHEE